MASTPTCSALKKGAFIGFILGGMTPAGVLLVFLELPPPDYPSGIFLWLADLAERGAPLRGMEAIAVVTAFVLVALGGSVGALFGFIGGAWWAFVFRSSQANKLPALNGLTQVDRLD
jgi:hypothetical protein